MDKNQKLSSNEKIELILETLDSQGSMRISEIAKYLQDCGYQITQDQVVNYFWGTHRLIDRVEKMGNYKYKLKGGE